MARILKPLAVLAAVAGLAACATGPGPASAGSSGTTGPSAPPASVTAPVSQSPQPLPAAGAADAGQALLARAAAQLARPDLIASWSVYSYVEPVPLRYSQSPGGSYRRSLPTEQKGAGAVDLRIAETPGHVTQYIGSVPLKVWFERVYTRQQWEALGVTGPGGAAGAGTQAAGPRDGLADVKELLGAAAMPADAAAAEDLGLVALAGQQVRYYVIDTAKITSPLPRVSAYVQDLGGSPVQTAVSHAANSAPQRFGVWIDPASGQLVQRTIASDPAFCRATPAPSESYCTSLPATGAPMTVERASYAFTAATPAALAAFTQFPAGYRHVSEKEADSLWRRGNTVEGAMPPWPER